MSNSTQKASQAEMVRKSLSHASDAVQTWRASKHAGAHVTVDPRQLASYYESAVPPRKK